MDSFDSGMIAYFIRRLRLASDNCSILLSWLISLANTRFLWIIDAAERPEPGAHAIDVATTQRNRKRVSGS